MNPEIKRYLDRHGTTYTPEALRKGLLDAGYDPVEVDAALATWNAREAGADAADRRIFGRWSLWLHLGALLAMVVLLIAFRGSGAVGTAGIAAVVLGIALVLGWAISSAIGRALLPRTGPMIALVVPAISAIALGGSCLALMVGSVPPAPHDGSVHLQILPPRAFEGSDTAACYLQDSGGVQVNSTEFGSLDGRRVSVFLQWYGDSPGAPVPPSHIDLTISLTPISAPEEPETYTPIFSSTIVVDAAADSRSGSLQFEGLVAEPIEGLAGETPPEPISGSITWTCE